MKINLKVRANNPVFWITLIPAVVALVYTILGACGITVGVSEDRVVDTAAAVIMALTTLGVLVDPTTSGLSDSVRALTYSKPSDSDVIEMSEYVDEDDIEMSEDDE